MVSKADSRSRRKKGQSPEWSEGHGQKSVMGKWVGDRDLSTATGDLACAVRGQWEGTGQEEEGHKRKVKVHNATL